MYYLGIDVARKSHVCIILDNDGEKVGKTIKIKNQLEDFHRLVQKLEKLHIATNDLLIGMEATGNMWENFYSFLAGKSFEVILLNPYQTHQYHKLTRKKAKTDDIDALVIAGLLRSNHYGKCIVPEETILELRQLTTLRYRLQKDIKNYQRQVMSLMNVIFPEYEDTCLKKLFSISSIQILLQFPTAKHLAQATTRKIEKIVRKIQGNNISVKQIENLVKTTQKSVYSGKAAHARSISIRVLLRQIQQLQTSMKELTEEMESTLKPEDGSPPFPGENLLTIKGVGMKTVAAYLSAIGPDGSQFPSQNALIGYIGFYPVIFQSGQRTKIPRLSKRGPKYLRWALYMAAVASLIHNKEMKTLYDNKISQGKASKQALICVAKKLALIMFSMLKSGEEYDPAKVFVKNH